MPDTPHTLQANYFELFHLPQTFELDLALLDQRYRDLQGQVHPDRFVAASAAEQLNSMRLATLANDAYRTLKHPTARARYLLQLQGVETLEESNTAMSADFLMLQMEWREAAEEAEAAGDVAALERLVDDINQLANQLHASLPALLAPQPASPAAAEAIRKLSFIDKIRADLEHTMETLES